MPARVPAIIDQINAPAGRASVVINCQLTFANPSDAAAFLAALGTNVAAITSGTIAGVAITGSTGAFTTLTLNGSVVAVASDVTTALALKAPLAGPTFTGTVVLPSTTSIGTLTATELSYVHGVTSAIQTQLGLKAPLASPTFTGTVVLPSTTSIGTLTATELGYVHGVTSAIQTQLTAKAPLADPTFMGNVVMDTARVTALSIGLAGANYFTFSGGTEARYETAQLYGAGTLLRLDTQMLHGYGSDPEGVLSGTPGEIIYRTDSVTAGFQLYFKTGAGSSGWMAMVAADTGWTANADAGDKTAVIPSSGDIAGFATALDGVSPGIGSAFAAIAAKCKALQSALSSALRPNA